MIFLLYDDCCFYFEIHWYYIVMCRAFLQRFKNEDTILFVLRVMVGVIILYDHVHPVGAFAKNSHVDVWFFY